MFLGFDSESKAYHLFDQTRHKVIISRDVVFDETKVGPQHLSYYEPPSEVHIPSLESDELSLDPTETQMIEPTEVPEPDLVSACDSHTHVNDKQQLQHPATETPPQTAHIVRPAVTEVIPLARRYPTRQRQPLVKMRDFLSLCSELFEEPISYSTAIQ